MSHDISPNLVGYQHKQTSPLFSLLIFFAGLLVVIAWSANQDPTAKLILMPVAVVFLLLAFCFFSLTTSVIGSHLQLRYGPIPLFGIRFDLSSIDQVVVDTTSIIDGWGIHYIPFRGWTYNLWGFRCVRIQMGNQTVRIGTNDAENLAIQIELAKQRLDDAGVGQM